MSSPPAWQPDPFGRFESRYWDGTTWTNKVATQGREYTDEPTGQPVATPGHVVRTPVGAVYQPPVGMTEEELAKQAAWRSKRNKILAGAAIFLAVAMVIGAIFGKDEATKESDRIGAYAACQIYVERRLKSPGSADFPTSRNITIVNTEDQTWVVRGYVDSENSFGASLRSDYRCEVDGTGDDWRLVDIDLTTRR